MLPGLRKITQAMKNLFSIGSEALKKHKNNKAAGEKQLILQTLWRNVSWTQLFWLRWAYHSELCGPGWASASWLPGQACCSPRVGSLSSKALVKSCSHSVNRPGQGQTLYHDNALTLHLCGVLRLSSVPHRGMFRITGSRHPYGCLDFFCFVWKVSPKVRHKSRFQEESYPVQLDLFWWHHRISAMSQVGVQRCPLGSMLDPSSLQLSLFLGPSLSPLSIIENFWPKQKQGE